MAIYTNLTDYCWGTTDNTITNDYWYNNKYSNKIHCNGVEGGNITVGNYGYINSGTATATNWWDNSVTYKLWDNFEYTGAAGTTDGELIVNGTGTIRYDSAFANKYVVWPLIEPSKNDLFKERIRSNLAIIVKSRVEMPQAVSPAERIAMETLREFISETEFRKYLRYGFVLVKGKSGDTFQVFRNRSHTKVWRNGQVVEEVCVRIQQDAHVPPTDNVIAFRSIIQSDEEAFRKLGNVYKMKKAA